MRIFGPLFRRRTKRSLEEPNRFSTVDTNPAAVPPVDVGNHDIQVALATATHRFEKISRLGDQRRALEEVASALGGLHKADVVGLIKEDVRSGGRAATALLVYDQGRYSHRKLTRPMRTLLERYSNDVLPAPSANKIAIRTHGAPFRDDPAWTQIPIHVTSSISYRLDLRVAPHLVHLLVGPSSIEVAEKNLGALHAVRLLAVSSLVAGTTPALGHSRADGEVLGDLAATFDSLAIELAESLDAGTVGGTRSLERIAKIANAEAAVLVVRPEPKTGPTLTAYWGVDRVLVSELETLLLMSSNELDGLGAPLGPVHRVIKKADFRSAWLRPTMLGPTAIGSALFLSKQDVYPYARFPGLIDSVLPLVAVSLSFGWKLSRAESELNIIGDFLERVVSGQAVDEILLACLNEAERRFPDEAVTILTLKGESLRVDYAVGKDAASVKGLSFPVTKGITGHAARDAEVINVPDVADVQDYIIFHPDTKSELAVPITYGEKKEVLGVLNIESPQANRYGEPDVEIATRIAQSTAVALRQAQLLGEVEDMSDRLQAMSRLVVAGDLVSGIGHDAQQVISTVRASAQTLQDLLQDLRANSLNKNQTTVVDEMVTKTRQIEDRLEEFQSLFSRLRDFANLSRTNPVVFEIRPLVDELLAVFRSKSGRRRAKLRSHVQLGLRAHADPNHVKYALWNLISNAFDARANNITVVGDMRVIDAVSYARILVDDDGQGVSPDISPRLFHRFATTKSDSGGTGLGLYFSKKIITEYNHGKIEFLGSDSNKSTKFAILIPSAP